MTTLTETANTAFAPAATSQAVDFLGLTILAGSVKRFVAFLRTERDRAREALRITRELNTYTDRQLAELGLSRLDIRAVAAGTFGA
jgi:uncharacterized protein YjiS (DUF1127 family)